jgi:hypothetical protein
MNYNPTYKNYSLATYDPIKWSIQTTVAQMLPTWNTYAKIKGKLALWQVQAIDYMEAIQTVKDVEQIKSPVLVLIK